MRQVTLITSISTSRGVRSALDLFLLWVVYGMLLISACAHDDIRDSRAPDHQGIIHEVRIAEGIGIVSRADGSEPVSTKLPPTGTVIQVREIEVAVAPRAIDPGDSVWVWFDSVERSARTSHAATRSVSQLLVIRE